VLARLEQVKAEVGTAETFVSYSQLRSPMHGIVAVKQVEPGSLAAPGTPLLTLEDDRNYRLEVSVDENQLGKIRLGSPVTLRIEALGGEELAGKVEEITPGMDSSSRSFLVKVGLPAGKSIRSGLFGRAVFRTGERQALLVPRRAVLERGQLSGVFVVDEAGTAHYRLIQPGRARGDRVEVLAGLTAGERIAVDGVERLTEGSRLQQRPPGESS
jgi:membrane fusion protein, multidrug efflux system